MGETRIWIKVSGELHPLALARMVYRTVSTVELDELISVCRMGPGAGVGLLLKPDTNEAFELAVQVNKAPETVEFKGRLNVAPEQIACAMACTLGMG